MGWRGSGEDETMMLFWGIAWRIPALASGAEKLGVLDMAYGVFRRRSTLCYIVQLKIMSKHFTILYIRDGI